MSPEGKSNSREDIRIVSGDSNWAVPDWEELVESEKDAKTIHSMLEAYLKRFDISLNSDTKVLEVGSGKGKLLELLAEKGIDAVGVDIRPRAEGAVMQVAARIEQLPFASETFDLVYSGGVFDSSVYRQDQERMLSEIERVLKPGGVYSSWYSRRMDVPVPEHFEHLGGSEDAQGLHIYRKK